MCASCNASCYCDAECQHRHWKAHKVICNTIKELSDREAEKCTFKNPDQGRRCVELVGRKCTVECRIQDLKVKAMWDTGAEENFLLIANFCDIGVFGTLIPFSNRRTSEKVDVFIL